MLAADIVDSIDRQTQQSEIASVDAGPGAGQARVRISWVTVIPSCSNSGGSSHQDRPWLDGDRACGSRESSLAAGLALQDLDDATRDLCRIAGIGTPLISRPGVHAGLEVVV